MLSIYVHWPFCLAKCPYCDFNSHVTQNIDHTLWSRSYLKELDYFIDLIKDKNISSIFFGGGTPSLMNPSIVESIINRLSKIAKFTQDIEITLEANPTSFETSKFREFKESGVNRISIGIQSFNNEDLKKLGREHDSIQAIEAIASANKLFDRVSFDLIYARQNQTLKDWQKELEDYFYLASGHISLYQLTLEKATPFYKAFKEGSLILPDSDISSSMYEWTNYYLKSKNYNNYEISNYSIIGQESKHNLVYWNYQNYLGIGPGAHSRIVIDDVINSIINYYNPEKWLKSLEEKGNSIQKMNKLSEKERIEEFFMMGLRLKKGIDFKNLKRITKIPSYNILDMKMLEQYQNMDLLTYSDNNIKFTDKGLMLHNYLLPRIIKL